VSAWLITSVGLPAVMSAGRFLFSGLHAYPISVAALTAAVATTGAMVLRHRIRHGSRRGSAS
jgi:hypothetical protein